MKTLITVLAVLAGPALAAEPLAIPLTVQEPAGLARSSEPVSAGVPLPWGQCKADQPFALFDGEREVPVQVLPLVVDEKGFLRWVLVDFQTDLPANASRALVLKAARPSASPASALKVAKGPAGVSVDTGKVAFTIAADKPFSLFSTAAVGGRPVAGGGEVSYVDGFDSKRYVADKPSSIAVEYAGPLRTTVCAKGRFVGDEANRFLYVARITAWAGRSDVHVKYSLANSNAENYCYRRVKDSTIALKLAAPPKAALLGAGKGLQAAGDCWLHQSSRVTPAVIHGDDVLGQCRWLRDTPGATGPGGAKAGSGQSELWTSQGKDDVAGGWIAANAGAASVWACDLYFVEDPPRRLALAEGTLRLTGVTEPLEGAKPPFNEPVRWLFDCSHLSSQYMLDFAAPAAPAELPAKATRARGRLSAMAPPAWYFQTESLPVGRFGTLADELACYDKWGWKFKDSDIPAGPTGQFTRIGRYVAADDNHFTSEQDTLDALVLMYLRTGRRAFLDAAEAWANYFCDLQTWRTDGWRWKDGGVWWHGGPAGNRPQRPADPVTGLRTSLPSEWTKQIKTNLGTWERPACVGLNAVFLAKACHCHNWGEGLAAWFCLTGDRDALEAAIDTAEQNIDTQRRAFGKAPGKPASFSRDFTRACYLVNATRMAVPGDPFITEASDYLAQVFLQRPAPEPRGFVNGPTPGKIDLANLVGPPGVEAMKALGVTMDAKTARLTDPKSGATWQPLANPHTWMFPPMSRAMEVYHRLTGSEDAQDWLVAYGQAVARVLYQPRHGNLSYGRMLVDFPLKGVAKDWASWQLPAGAVNGEGVVINGYLGMFYPDVPARAYSLTGEALLKQRACDYWYYSSHRGYNSTKMHSLGGVGRWVNCYSTHDETVCYTGRTFYEWAHDRPDAQPPAAVTDLKVTLAGDKATITFTAPSDAGGGTAARYQLKCADRPIVDYEQFLKAWAANEDAKVCNWWLAANLTGEPSAAEPGRAVSFVVAGLPKDAACFALRTFDDSNNRSPISNVAKAR